MVTRKNIEQILDYIRVPRFIYENQFNLALFERPEKDLDATINELKLISELTGIPFGFLVLTFNKKTFKPHRLPFFIPVRVKKLPIRWAGAITVYPFVFFRDLKVYEVKGNQKINRKLFITLTHELIHIKQQKELLLLPFALIYVLHYIFLRLKGYKHFEAYLRICFEAEAFAKQFDLNLLKTRKPFAWIKFCEKAKKFKQ